MKLTIENFQCHKHTELDLVEGTNVLSGVSDAGKSAVILAINWLVNNDPSGDEFCSHWGGNTLVSFALSDVTITRTKGKNINEYSLQIGDGEPQVFTGFGVGVPEPIKEALNLHDVNLRFQHQGTFLLSQTPGEVSRYLNRVIKMEVIDTTIANIEKELNQERIEEAAERNTMKRLTEELKQFEFLVDAERDLQSWEKQQTLLDNEIIRYNTLFDIQENIKIIQAESKPYEEVLGAEPEVTLLSSKVQKMEKPKSESSRLKQLRNTLTQTKEEIKTKSMIIGAVDIVERLVGKEDTRANVSIQRKNLRVLVDALKRTTMLRATKQKELKAKEEEFNEAMPDECPLCGRM